MTLSLQQVFQNKDFYKLPLEERHKVISEINPDFGQLPIEEQEKAYIGLESKFKGSSKQERPRVLSAQEEALESPLISPTEIIPGIGVAAWGGRKIGETALKFVGRALGEGIDYMLWGGKSLGKGVIKGGAKAASVKNIEKRGVGYIYPEIKNAPNVLNKPIAQTISKILSPEERATFVNQFGKNTETRFGKVGKLSDEDLMRVKTEALKQPPTMVSEKLPLPETIDWKRDAIMAVNKGRDPVGAAANWYRLEGKMYGGDRALKDRVESFVADWKIKNQTIKPQAFKQPSFAPTEPQVGKTTRERGFITSVKEKFPEVEKRVSGQYIPRSTDNLSIKASNLIKNDIDKAETIARMGTDDNSVATSSELIKHYVEKGSKPGANKNLNFDKAADIAHITAQKLTESGRAVQAASILGRLTPEGQLRFAARTINRFNETAPVGKKIPNLTPKQTGDILTRSKKISAMPDGRDKAKEFFKLQESISKLVPTPMYKKIINIWKAGLLTGIKTSGLNTFSNLFHGISETAKDIPAAAVDSVVSLFTKKRTLEMTTKGTGRGTKEGFSKGWDYLKTGFDERNIRAKLDSKKVHFGEGKFAKAIQAYEETVFRIMGAEDQPFYYGAKARSLQSQAIAQAKNKGLKGNEAKSFVDGLVQNPSDEMLRYAVNDAETSVFQNRTALGSVGKAIQDIPGGFGEIIVPFSRTPSSVAMQLVNYSPVGVVNTIIRSIGKGKFDQRLFSQGMGRAITGTGAMAIGMALYDKDLIELGSPKTERESKLWELEGRKTNSIKVNGKWRSANVLGPLGYTLIVGGYFKRELNKSGSPTKAINQAIIGGGKSLTEQTFLKGTSAMIEALNDPERYGESLISGMAGSVVPTLVSDIARTNDATERRIENAGQAVKSRVPGLRNTLEPKINVFGQDLPRYGGNVLEVMIDPTRPSKIKNDVVVDELRRLDKKEFKVTPTLLGDREGYKSLTPEQNTQLWKTAGRLTYNSIFNDISEKDYRNLGDEDKAKVITARTKYSKDVARASMIDQIIKSTKTPEERKNKIEGLYEDKFINQDVLKIYDELNQ